MVAQIFHVIGNTAISKIQVIGLCRIFGSQRVNLLHHRKDTRLLAVSSDIQAALFHVAIKPDGTSNLEISEALHLCFTKQINRHIGHLLMVVSPFMQFLGGIHYVLQFLQKPFIYLGQLMDLVYGITRTHGFADDEDALVGRLAQSLVHIGYYQFFILYKAVHTLTDHAQSFLNSFFKGTSDCHYFSHRFHGRA